MWLTSVDPGQLATALLNLVLNARDAMPDGGRLMVEVRNNSLGQSDLDVNGEPRPGDYVMVAVTDTGCGMAADVASRAFEPFFTTKEVGKGTGLGLSMVYGFAQQSGGLVQLQSEPGQGSVVRLFFPRIAATLNEDPTPAEQIIAPDGTETVLVVEDDDMVRAYVESELRTLGYRVIASSNGPAALEVLRQRGDIHLLFTDVVMPGGMFGPELARQAIALRPDLKVLFTSGYSQNPVKTPDRGRRQDPDQTVQAAGSCRDAAVRLIGAVALARHQQQRNAEIGCEQRRVDDEDPEHRAFQHRPVSYANPPAAHQHRKVIGELAEVACGEEQEQRKLRLDRLEERRTRGQQIEREKADRQIHSAEERNAGRQGRRDRIAALFTRQEDLQRVGLRNAELDEGAAEPERVEQQDEIRKVHDHFP